jgi:lysozyme
MGLLDKLAEQLRRDEGVRFRPYADTKGKITIGVGRNLTDKGITPRESDYLLGNDIDEAECELHQLMPWTDKLDDARRGVLIAMVFNMGITAFQDFEKFLALVNAGNYTAAGAEMLNSKWAKQVGARANRLSRQMVSGEWT